MMFSEADEEDEEEAGLSVSSTAGGRARKRACVVAGRPAKRGREGSPWCCGSRRGKCWERVNISRLKRRPLIGRETNTGRMLAGNCRRFSDSGTGGESGVKQRNKWSAACGARLVSFASSASNWNARRRAASRLVFGLRPSTSLLKAGHLPYPL